MRSFLFSVFLSLFIFDATGQIPPGYYDSAAGLYGLPLKVALHNIIDDHTQYDYSVVIDLFETTDKKPNGKVWDIYSDIPGGTPPYEYSFTPSDQCGSYSQEGDCYNREHTWPKSWFGGEVYPMYSDIFILYPTDGFVNGQRSNYPYGEVNSASWTSQNGSKRGNNSYPGYSGSVFEPIDEYKGDLARVYFYFSVRYYGEDSGWPGSDMTTGAELKTWAYNMMYDWHTSDPVSQKEIDRNDSIYQLQHNRNPFVDHPEWIDSVWNPSDIEAARAYRPEIVVFPNPAEGNISITCSETINAIRIYNSAGIMMMEDNIPGKSKLELDLTDLKCGVYFLHITTENSSVCRKLLLF
ncbi:MAG: endonuclease [Bacteroidota bacterium]